MIAWRYYLQHEMNVSFLIRQPVCMAMSIALKSGIHALTIFYARAGVPAKVALQDMDVYYTYAIVYSGDIQ